MASQKLYRALAFSIRRSLKELDYRSDPEEVASLVRSLADDLKTDNSRFRYDVFYEACGLDENGKWHDE